jgi:hypothetical protein
MLSLRLARPVDENNPTTEYMRIPNKGEVSHMAEGYHNAVGITGYKEGMTIELVTLETRPMNLTRCLCRRYGLMWLKADGTPIPDDELDTYSGETLCMHGKYGQPCYGLEPPRTRGIANTIPETETGPNKRPLIHSGMSEKRRVEIVLGFDKVTRRTTDAT